MTSLSPKQRAIVRMVCSGLRDREIGERLGLPRRWVQGQVQRICRVLDVGSRGELAVVAAKEGLLVRAPLWSRLVAEAR